MCLVIFLKYLFANTEKYLQSDWLRGVKYWPYLYSFFNICTLCKQEENKQSETHLISVKIEMYPLKTN